MLISTTKFIYKLILITKLISIAQLTNSLMISKAYSLVSFQLLCNILKKWVLNKEYLWLQVEKSQFLKTEKYKKDVFENILALAVDFVLTLQLNKICDLTSLKISTNLSNSLKVLDDPFIIAEIIFAFVIKVAFCLFFKDIDI